MLNNLKPDFADVQSLLTSKQTSEQEPTIALLHCYDLIDDFLDSIHISFDTFCQEFVGSWMFGYIHALKTAGVRTVLFCISARVTETTRYQHRPSGATICVLPASRAYCTYRGMRDRLLRAYGGNTGQSFRQIPDANVVRRSLLTGIKDIAKSAGTYLSTPVNLLAIALKQEGCQAIVCQEYEFARFDTCVWLGKRLGLPMFATFQGGNATQSYLESLPRRLAFRFVAVLSLRLRPRSRECSKLTRSQKPKSPAFLIRSTSRCGIAMIEHGQEPRWGFLALPGW
jgi:starch synthase